MLRVLKPSVLGIFLFSSLCTVGLSSTQVSADVWRSWEDMAGGGYAVTYGSKIHIYDCWASKRSVSLQFRNKNNKWQNLETVISKKSSTTRCRSNKQYPYITAFGGTVTALGQQLDDGVYLEMRMFSPKQGRDSAYTSDPALIPQYKSYADKVGQIAEAMRKALDKLFRGDDS